MLSYRHGFHAGNYGDIIKHLVLSLIIDYLKKKPAPIRYIDTHAGAGNYSVVGATSAKTGEFSRGVGSLDLSALPVAVEVYRKVIANYLEKGQYPGSPAIAADLLRDQDELRLFELHTTEFPILYQRFAHDRRVRVSNEDGYQSLKALLPVNNARALVLIDPSYELKNEYALILAALQEGYARMPNAVFALWYPVITGQAIDYLFKKVAAIAVKDVWRYELRIEAESRNSPGMTASGMLVINPPWSMATTLPPVLDAICRQLPYPDMGFAVESLGAG